MTTAIEAGPVPDQGMIDAAGTVRRLRALIACGHPPVVLAAALGMTHKQFTNLMVRRWVTLAEARTVDGLYRRRWNRPPDQSTQAARFAVSKARGYAARRNFAPPLAWDEYEGDPHWIDDPAAGPAPGSWPWRRLQYSRPELADEAQFLLDTGCIVETAATRLGFAVDTIKQALREARPEPGSAAA